MYHRGPSEPMAWTRSSTLFAMWQNGATYDEHQFLDARRAAQGPSAVPAAS